MRVVDYRVFKENGELQQQCLVYDGVKTIQPAIKGEFMLLIFKESSSYYNINKDHSLFVDVDEYDTFIISEE